MATSGNSCHDLGTDGGDHSWMSKEHGPPDVTLDVDGEMIPCHRKVLQESSCYFRAMFSCDMKESHEEVVKLNEVPFVGIRRLIKFAYIQLLILEEDTVLDVTQVASMLQFTKALQKCEAYLVDHLSVSNCLEYMYIGDSCGLNDIYNKAKQHVLWEFERISHQPSFLALNETEICQLLEEDKIHVESELCIFNAVMSWVNFLREKRLKSVPTLFRYIRFGVLTKDELALVAESEVLQQCSRSMALVRNLQNAGENATLLSLLPEMLFRRRTVPRVLCFLGLLNDRDAKDGDEEDDADESYPCGRPPPGGSPQLLTLSDDVNQAGVRMISICPNLSQLPQGYSATVVGPDLYICGGQPNLGRNTWNQNVVCYFGLVGVWDVVSQLPQPRRHHSAVEWQNHLYLIGGVGRHRVILENVERFNLNTGDWEKMPSLLKPVYSAAACVCADKLYVIKHHMEYLQKDTLQWTLLEAPLPYTKGISRCYTFKSMLFIVTKYDENQLSVYDIETGSVSAIEKEDPIFSTVLTAIDGDIYTCVNQDDQLRILRFSTVNDTVETLHQLPESSLLISEAFPMSLFPVFR